MSWPFLDQPKIPQTLQKHLLAKIGPEVTMCVFHWLHGFMQAKKQNIDRKTAEDSFHNP
jgi:hypothetical protein